MECKVHPVRLLLLNHVGESKNTRRKTAHPNLRHETTKESKGLYCRHLWLNRSFGKAHLVKKGCAHLKKCSHISTFILLNSLNHLVVLSVQIYTGKYSNAVGSGLWRLHPLGFEEFGRRKRDKEFLGEKN